MEKGKEVILNRAEMDCDSVVFKQYITPSELRSLNEVEVNFDFCAGTVQTLSCAPINSFKNKATNNQKVVFRAIKKSSSTSISVDYKEDSFQGNCVLERLKSVSEIVSQYQDLQQVYIIDTYQDFTQGDVGESLSSFLYVD